MRLLFTSKIVLDRKKIDYNIYQFKLNPDRYKAESLLRGEILEEIVFWRRKNRWKAERKECQRLVEILGKKIEAFKNN